MPCAFMIPLPSDSSTHENYKDRSSHHPLASHFNCFGSAKSILFDLINVLSVIGRLFAELQLS